MREHNTYRSERRQLMRSAGKLNKWSDLEMWAEANQRAKLNMRAGQCMAARAFLVKALAQEGRRATGRRRDALITSALYTFWFAQKPRTRVISRILKELDYRPLAVI